MKPTILIVIIGLIIISGCIENKIPEEEYCETLKKDVNEEIEKANYCDEDSDCVALSPDFLICPFGCYLLLNKNADITQIQNGIKNYGKNCPLCKYRCSYIPSSSDIKCTNNKCLDIRFEKPIEVCVTDSDCVLTTYPENNCCQICKKEAITKREEGVRSSWREENCAEKDYRNCPEEVECIMKEEEAGCVEGECVVIEKMGTTSTQSYLSSKSCDELIDLQNKEYNKLDFSCKTDEDCVSSDAFFCSGCLNKNADIKMYEAVTNTLYNRDDCLIAYPACLVFVGCKCTNDKCESLFK